MKVICGLRKKDKGFSLIELIVVLAVIISLTGVSMVNFVSFRDKRRALEDARLVAAELRKVRAKSVAVEVPVGCVGVADYTFSVVAFGKNTNTSVNCKTGSVTNYL